MALKEVVKSLGLVWEIGIWFFNKRRLGGIAGNVGCGMVVFDLLKKGKKSFDEERSLIKERGKDNRQNS